MIRSHTFRQVLIVAGLTFCCMSDGFIFGQMSGMINALSAADSPIPLTEDDISWIASTVNITCFFGCFVVCMFSKILGRRTSLIVLNTPVLICWIVVYFVQNKYVLLLTRAIVGMSFGGILLLTFVNIGEYVAPNIRHFCLNFMSSVGTLSGITLGHVFSLLMNWREVALFGIIPTGLSCLLPLFWVESPLWLASQGKFEQCEKAFRALHAPCEETDAEIQYIIAFEKEKQRGYKTNHNSKSHLRKILSALQEPYFWKVQLMALIVNSYKTAAGRTLISTITITMLQEITGRTNILFYTLLVDGFGIFGAAIACVLLSKYKIRTIFFTSGIIANVLLLLFSASLHYVPNEGWFPWIKIVLLASYCVILNAGLTPLFDIIVTDNQPLEIKEFSMFFMGFFAGVVQFLGIKLSGSIISAIDYSGIFILNSVIAFLCMVYLWIFLPETKDRALQEIDVFLKTGKFENRDKYCLNSEYNNGLLKA